MSCQINNLAIALTKKLETAIIETFIKNKTSPSYYNIRSILFTELSGFIKTLHVEMKDSPMMINSMPEEMKAGWSKQVLKRQAQEISELILGTKFINQWEFVDDYSYYRSISTTVALIDLSMVKERCK